MRAAASRRNHHVLSAAGQAESHGRCLADVRQSCVPQRFAGLDVKGAQGRIVGGCDEDQPTSRSDGTAQVDGARIGW